MGFLSIVQLIFFVIRYLPTLFDLVKEIIKQINRIKDPKEKAEVKAELHAAVVKAKFGDQRPLRDLFDRFQSA